MATNTNLTRETAIQMIKEQEVICPNCGKGKLQPRYTYKNQNVEHICAACKEVYHPAKFI